MKLSYRLSPQDAYPRTLNNEFVIVDIRDNQAYLQNHISTAIHLSHENFNDFVDKTDRQQPVLVYCYHGNSSQQVALYLQDKGFETVFSLDGGFEYWRTHYPENCSK